MELLKGDQVSAADLILKYGIATKQPVYLSILYNKGLQHLTGLTIEDIDLAGQFLEKLNFVEITHTPNMGVTYILTDNGRLFAESGKSIREKITEIESDQIKAYVERLTQSENDKQDKDLERQSQVYAVKSAKNNQWQFWVMLVIAVVSIIVAVILDSK